MERQGAGHKSIRELTVKKRSRERSHLSATFLSSTSSSPPCSLLSRPRESLVEQIGTNDRRKAVKAEFIYAFLP